jgi:uncharacterized membrane protein
MFHGCKFMVNFMGFIFLGMFHKCLFFHVHISWGISLSIFNSRTDLTQDQIFMGCFMTLISWGISWVSFSWYVS